MRRLKRAVAAFFEDEPTTQSQQQAPPTLGPQSALIPVPAVHYAPQPIQFIMGNFNAASNGHPLPQLPNPALQPQQVGLPMPFYAAPLEIPQNQASSHSAAILQPVSSSTGTHVLSQHPRTASELASQNPSIQPQPPAPIPCPSGLNPSPSAPPSVASSSRRSAQDTSSAQRHAQVPVEGIASGSSASVHDKKGSSFSLHF
jgi:hypothetical protein